MRNPKKPIPTHRTWKNLPVVEATHELRIFVLQCDIEGAVQKDWAHCVLAKSCARAFEAKRVAVFATIAYVELPQEDGTHAIERFVLPPETQRAIKKFDRDHIAPKGGFLFLPPTPAERLDTKMTREIKRRRKEREKKRAEREAVIKGERLPDPEESKRKRKPKRDRTPVPQMLFNWRNGSGMVNFTRNGVEGVGVREAPVKQP